MDRKKAIETVRLCCPRISDSDCDFETAMRVLVPELAESEDEKIRRKMVEHFKNKTKETWCNMPVKDIIAYLEKQKEQKPAEWNEEDEDMRLEAIRVLVSGCERYRKESGCLPSWHKVINWLKSLPLALKKKNEDVAKLCSNEWSEEDERMLKWIEDILLIADDDLSDKLNGRVSPITDSAYSSMKLCIAKCLSWLKSLKPSWKPSEEQMNSLNLGIYALEEGGYYETASEIKELYEQLKKLM